MHKLHVYILHTYCVCTYYAYTYYAYIYYVYAYHICTCYVHTYHTYLMRIIYMMQDPRLLSYKLRLRYNDFDKVDHITKDINDFFEQHPGVDQKLPHKAALTDLATYSVDLSITVCWP